jgi:hypothetical protein
MRSAGRVDPIILMGTFLYIVEQDMILPLGKEIEALTVVGSFRFARFEKVVDMNDKDAPVSKSV